MPEWIIELSASDDDLERLLRLPERPDWHIEMYGNRGVVIRGGRFDREADHRRVSDIAKTFVEKLDRALRRETRGFKEVTFKGVNEIKDGGLIAYGTGRAMAGTARIEAHGVAIGLDGKVIRGPDQSEVAAQRSLRLVELQDTHADLADALRYLDGNPDMAALFKAYEAICAAVSGKDVPIKMKWTTQQKRRRFTGSAQPHRHHDWRGEVPAEPMSREEAKTYVHDLLNKLIVYLAAQVR